MVRGGDGTLRQVADETGEVLEHQRLWPSWLGRHEVGEAVARDIDVGKVDRGLEGGRAPVSGRSGSCQMLETLCGQFPEWQTTRV